MVYCVRNERLSCELICVRPDQTANIKTKVDFMGKCLICFLKKVTIYFDVIIHKYCQPDDNIVRKYYVTTSTFSLFFEDMIRY